jgi:hypothetical protein
VHDLDIEDLAGPVDGEAQADRTFGTVAAGCIRICLMG